MLNTFKPFSTALNVLALRAIFMGMLTGYVQLSTAMGLSISTSTQQCGATEVIVTPPASASKRIANSQAVSGQKDIAWAWLGTPTVRYPHMALGAATHAGTLHVLPSQSVTTNQGALKEMVYELPLNRVFEDRVPRLVDLDADGRDEIIVIESDAMKGSALVVLGIRGGKLAEIARSASNGSTFRWLNPVGVADFDGDGKLDIASVTTPHVGGILKLYHFKPPKLEQFARTMDVSNHRMGDLEQQLAVVIEKPGMRPTIIVPDMQLKALHALRWEAPGKWKELADVIPLQATVQRLTPLTPLPPLAGQLSGQLAGQGCLQLTDKSWWTVQLN